MVCTCGSSSCCCGEVCKCLKKSCCSCSKCVTVRKGICRNCRCYFYYDGMHENADRTVKHCACFTPDVTSKQQNLDAVIPVPPAPSNLREILLTEGNVGDSHSHHNTNTSTSTSSIEVTQSSVFNPKIRQTKKTGRICDIHKLSMQNSSESMHSITDSNNNEYKEKPAVWYSNENCAAGDIEKDYFTDVVDKVHSNDSEPNICQSDGQYASDAKKDEHFIKHKGTVPVNIDKPTTAIQPSQSGHLEQSDPTKNLHEKKYPLDRLTPSVLPNEQLKSSNARERITNPKERTANFEKPKLMTEPKWTIGGGGESFYLIQKQSPSSNLHARGDIVNELPISFKPDNDQRSLLILNRLLNNRRLCELGFQAFRSKSRREIGPPPFQLTASRMRPPFFNPTKKLFRHMAFPSRIPAPLPLRSNISPFLIPKNFCNPWAGQNVQANLGHRFSWRQIQPTSFDAFPNYSIFNQNASVKPAVEKITPHAKVTNWISSLPTSEGYQQCDPK